MWTFEKSGCEYVSTELSFDCTKTWEITFVAVYFLGGSYTRTAVSHLILNTSGVDFFSLILCNGIPQYPFKLLGLFWEGFKKLFSNFNEPEYPLKTVSPFLSALFSVLLSVEI